jgi:hypothetical protein
MLTNPFRRRFADGMTYAEIGDLFAKPSACDELLEEGHCLVLGGRWTGKTTLLKALSLSARPKPGGPVEPPFLGVYVPLKWSQIRPLLQLYERTSDDRLFEDFLAWYVLSCFAEQVGDLPEAADNGQLAAALLQACGLDMADDVGIRGLGALKETAKSTWQDRCRTANALDGTSTHYQGLASADLARGLQVATEWLWQHGAPQHPLALLFDGLDTAGPLSSSVLALMRKENLGFLVVKAGVYALEDVRPLGFSRAEVAYPDDFGIVCLEPDPPDGQFYDFCRHVAQKRWDAFVRQCADELSGPVLYEVAEVFPRGNGPYSGLDRLASLAAGNVQWFLETCESAWDKHVRASRGSAPGSVVSPEHQEDALSEKSTDYYQSIPAQARDLGLPVQSLVYGLGSHLARLEPEQAAAGMGLTDRLQLDQRLVPVLRRAISRGILRVPARDRIRSELSEGHLPSDLFLNDMLFPKFGIRWDARGIEPVAPDTLLQWCTSPAEGQLDFFRGPSRKHKEQSEMFPERAFLSARMGDRRSERAMRILRVIHAITKDMLQHEERLPQRLRWKDVCEDVHDMQVRGDFADRIDEVIRDALYVIHDVTDYTRGVGFEIGLSMGHRKAHFLIFDRNVTSFGELPLPSLVKNMVDVKGYSFTSPKFKSWLDQQVVQVGWSYHGSIVCPRQWDRPCSFEEYQRRKADRAYVHMSPAEEGVASLVLECLRQRGFTSIQPEDVPVDHEFCRLCCAIRQAKFCLIGYRNDDPEAPVVLGLALAAGSPTVQVRNTTEEALPMWGSRPVMEWTRDTLKTDIPDGVDSFLARLPRRSYG